MRETYQYILDLHVGEARLLDPILHAAIVHGEVNTGLPLDFGPNLSPLIEGGIGRHSSVDAFKGSVTIEMLNPATGLSNPICLLIQGLPILESTAEPPDMNIIEVVVGVGPRLCGIVDIELEIGGDPGRLDWGDIGTDHVAGGKLIRKIAVNPLLAISPEHS